MLTTTLCSQPSAPTEVQFCVADQSFSDDEDDFIPLTWFRVIIKSLVNDFDDVNDFHCDFEDEAVVAGSTNVSIEECDGFYDLGFKTTQDVDGVVQTLRTIADDYAIEIVEVKHFKPTKAEADFLNKKNYRALQKELQGIGHDDTDKICNRFAILTRLTFDDNDNVVQEERNQNLFEMMCEFEAVMY